MLNFFNDYVRFDRGLNYQALKVKENFDKVLDTLGEPDKRDTIISITIRLKGKADWIAANNASNALEFKVSRRIWGRKSKYVNFLMLLLLKVVRTGIRNTYTHLLG